MGRPAALSVLFCCGLIAATSAVHADEIQQRTSGKVQAVSPFKIGAPVWLKDILSGKKDDPAPAVRSVKGERRVASFMQGYALSPEPDRLPWLIETVDKLLLAQSAPKSADLYAGFFWGVFADNPDKVYQWFSPSSPYGEKTVSLLKRAASAGPVKGMRLRTVADIPAIWGAFLATGDMSLVEKIVGASLSGDEALKAAAAASLRNYAFTHEAVARMVKNRIALEPDEAVRKRLASLTLWEAPPSSFGDRTGDFSARLVIVPLDEAQRLSEEVLRAEDLPLSVATAKPGDKLGLLVVFTGVGLSEDLTASVDYDMNLSGPEGQPLPGAAFAYKPALNRKVPGRYGFFASPAFMGLEFEDADRPGTYTVTARIRDNIAHRDIPLTATVTLTPGNL